MAWKRLARELGFDFSEADNERLKGVSRMDSLEILLEVGGIIQLDEQEKQAMADRKNKWYVDYVSQMTPDDILPGVLVFLYSIKAAGIKMAIGSASKNAGMTLERTGLISFFDAIIDGNKISKAKPDPQVFLMGAQELGVPPSQCIVFEDAAAGIEAAINAGMKSIGVGKPSVLRRATIAMRCLEDMTWQILNVLLN